MTEQPKPIYIFISFYFPTPTSWRGGFCYDFVRAVQRTGKYDVRVFVPGGKNASDYVYNGVKVYRFHFRGFPCGLFPFLLESVNTRSFLKKAKEVGIDWSRVSIYHANETHLTRYAVPMKKVNPDFKILFQFHSGPGIFLRSGRLGVVPIHSNFLYCYLRRCLECVDLPVFVSRIQQMSFGKWYPNGFLQPPRDIRHEVWFGRWLRPIRLRRSYVLHNGIDYDVFNVNGRVPHTGFRIGCVGNITENKDQLTLLRALTRIRNIPDLHCDFIGSGPMLERCKEFVESNRLSSIVTFHAEVDHLRLPDFYRSLDLFVLPSWIEGFCCSYMEAYGCGTPFMGCQGVSVEEAMLPEEQKRWLFAKCDDEMLAHMIQEFYHERPVQHLIHDYDIDRLVGDFLMSL